MFHDQQDNGHVRIRNTKRRRIEFIFIFPEAFFGHTVQENVSKSVFWVEGRGLRFTHHQNASLEFTVYKDAITQAMDS